MSVGSGCLLHRLTWLSSLSSLLVMFPILEAFYGAFVCLSLLFGNC